MTTQQAIWKNTIIAESDRTVVVEGNHYFPADSMRFEYLEPSDTHTRCAWKGTASYHDVVVDGARNRDAAWHYPNPSDAAQRIAGHIAFWRGVKVRPRRSETDGAEVATSDGWLRRFLRSSARSRSSIRAVNQESVMTNPATITDADFDEQVRRTDRPVLVDFWAAWCAPCRAMEPIVHALAEGYGQRVTIAKVDVDANPRTAGKLGIRSIPTMILFDHGEPVQRLVGVQQRELLEGLLDGVLASADNPAS
jgi:thioredoxin